MDTFTRICKKCLLREMSEADTYKTMYEYIANLSPDDKTPEHEYETRLSQCKTCDHLLSGMCRICGCYVEMRAAITHRHCPDIHPELDEDHRVHEEFLRMCGEK